MSGKYKLIKNKNRGMSLSCQCDFLTTKNPRQREKMHRNQCHISIICKLPLTSVSKSDEESVEELGEPVSKVLNEIDPEKSPILANPILTFSGCKPRGHPSSCNQISQKKVAKTSNRMDKNFKKN